MRILFHRVCKLFSANPLYQECGAHQNMSRSVVLNKISKPNDTQAVFHDYSASLCQGTYILTCLNTAMGCHSVCQKQRKENLVLPNPIQMMLHTFYLPGRQHRPHPINLYIWERRNWRREGGRERRGEGERPLPTLPSRAVKAGFAIALLKALTQIESWD